MYMLGRFRTASRPSRTVIEDAPYAFFAVATCLLVAPVSFASMDYCPAAGFAGHQRPARTISGEGGSVGPLAAIGGTARSGSPRAADECCCRHFRDQIDRLARSVCGHLRAHCGRNLLESTGYCALRRPNKGPVDAVAWPADRTDSDGPIPGPCGPHRGPDGDRFRGQFRTLDAPFNCPCTAPSAVGGSAARCRSLGG